MSDQCRYCDAAQAPAKATRKVFMEGKHTGNNSNRAYGLRVFSTLALKYQAISKDGAEPSLREGMATRVHMDSPLSLFAGPYARLLEETLDVIVTAVTERHLREVRVRVKQLSCFVVFGRSGHGMVEKREKTYPTCRLLSTRVHYAVTSHPTIGVQRKNASA